MQMWCSMCMQPCLYCLHPFSAEAAACLAQQQSSQLQQVFHLTPWLQTLLDALCFCCHVTYILTIKDDHSTCAMEARTHVMFAELHELKLYHLSHTVTALQVSRKKHLRMRPSTRYAAAMWSICASLSLTSTKGSHATTSTSFGRPGCAIPPERPDPDISFSFLQAGSTISGNY